MRPIAVLWMLASLFCLWANNALAEDDCAAREAPCRAGLRLNDIQAIGSHNSYKEYIPPLELELLASVSQEAAFAFDYGHAPLEEQLSLGMRQLELDIYYDPYGSRYAEPILPKISAGVGGEPYDDAHMHEPGFKVLHVQDIDVHSRCKTFIRCLREIDRWSRANPGHLPILILINGKQDKVEQLPGAVIPFPLDGTAFDALDAEIASVFDRARLITPDDVRGSAATLREAVATTGWPTLESARGKILFALDNGPEIVAQYLRDRPSLQGLPMFVNSHNDDADHAAYMTINNPVADADRIKAAVKAGFLVRTRADANTVEARRNDTRRREAALASGAHYISTDYYKPRPDFSPYSVAMPGGATGRCNPVRAAGTCEGPAQ